MAYLHLLCYILAGLLFYNWICGGWLWLNFPFLRFKENGWGKHSCWVQIYGSWKGVRPQMTQKFCINDDIAPQIFKRCKFGNAVFFIMTFFWISVRKMSGKTLTVIRKTIPKWWIVIYYTYYTSRWQIGCNFILGNHISRWFSTAYFLNIVYLMGIMGICSIIARIEVVQSCYLSWVPSMLEILGQRGAISTDLLIEFPFLLPWLAGKWPFAMMLRTI